MEFISSFHNELFSCGLRCTQNVFGIKTTTMEYADAYVPYPELYSSWKLFTDKIIWGHSEVEKTLDEWRGMCSPLLSVLNNLANMGTFLSSLFSQTRLCVRGTDIINNNHVKGLIFPYII